MGRIIREATATEMVKFACVGLSGVGVNLGVFFILTRACGLSIRLAAPLAIEASVISNFLLNDSWTFRRRSTANGGWGRLMRFHAVCALGGVVNYAVLIALVEMLHWLDLLANLMGIVAATAVNFVMHSTWTWRVRAPNTLTPERPVTAVAPQGKPSS